MLGVWVVYLQVFLRGYRRQARAKIVINRAVGVTLDAHCFISNMSSHAIYVESVIVTVRAEGVKTSRGVTDFDILPDNRPTDPRMATHQGPLHSGDQTSIGTFSELIRRVATSQGDKAGEIPKTGQPMIIEVMVIADYQSEELVVGAKREFTAERQGGSWLVRPRSVQTRQIRSWRKRRAIRKIVADDIGHTS